MGSLTGLRSANPFVQITVQSYTVTSFPRNSAKPAGTLASNPRLIALSLLCPCPPPPPPTSFASTDPALQCAPPPLSQNPRRSFPPQDRPTPPPSLPPHTPPHPHITFLHHARPRLHHRPRPALPHRPRGPCSSDPVGEHGVPGRGLLRWRCRGEGLGSAPGSRCVPATSGTSHGHGGTTSSGRDR